MEPTVVHKPGVVKMTTSKIEPVVPNSIITICINRCRSGCGYIEPGSGDSETDMCAYKDLCITLGSDEAGGYDGSDDK